MPRGQSHTTWFPELKIILANQWEFNLKIEDHFELVKILNIKLNKVRDDLNVKPPIFYCYNCEKSHESELSQVTITSMYFALERFELCTHKEHLELKRNWNKYSKQNLINIWGLPLNNDKTRKHNTG